MSAWAAVSTRVWPVPSTKPVSISSGMLTKPSSTAAAKVPTAARRAVSTTHSTRRRSQRSTSAPASRPNSSHGSHSANTTAEIGSGLRVSVAASSGSAVAYTPSPTLETACADQSLAKSGPSPFRPFLVPPVWGAAVATLVPAGPTLAERAARPACDCPRRLIIRLITRRSYGPFSTRLDRQAPDLSSPDRFGRPATAGGRLAVAVQHRPRPPTTQQHQVALVAAGSAERVRPDVAQHVRVQPGDPSPPTAALEHPVDAVPGQRRPPPVPKPQLRRVAGGRCCRRGRRRGAPAP